MGFNEIRLAVAQIPENCIPNESREDCYVRRSSDQPIDSLIVEDRQIIIEARPLLDGDVSDVSDA